MQVSIYGIYYKVIKIHDIIPTCIYDAAAGVVRTFVYYNNIHKIYCWKKSVKKHP